ncbi:uncharacterized protein LOC113545950 isoform X3 [Pangasianodon hypophthalmus]|uniref:uncharacterized protein LOC113545950 isoform X3 n=1 Tax=Pangasianodon hypophthalmus TaxID=310915 RepID=UPI0023073146|nr:uncharacterized protein LOC113545950 isoform X3 [Pangasianodon hypophthalmus]
MSPNFSQPTSTSPPTAFPVFTVITVSVILLVLLAGISILTVTLRKRFKLQGQETITQLSRGTNREDENEPQSVYESVIANTYQLDPVYENLSY